MSAGIRRATCAVNLTGAKGVVPVSLLMFVEFIDATINDIDNVAVNLTVTREWCQCHSRR